MRRAGGLTGTFSTLMWIWMAAALAPCVHGMPPAETPAVVVRGPTVVACFVPVSDAEMDSNPDLNEALADFQLYSAQARRPLQRRGIAYHVLSARSFRMRINGKVNSYRVEGAAYYFVAPGKKPQIETGVMTDTDLLAAADKYFGSK